MDIENNSPACPLCGRIMGRNGSMEEHHLIPKSLKGKETITLHKICHQKIHSVFTERELQRQFNNIETIKKHIEIKKFIKWVSKREPEYYIRNKDTKTVKLKKKEKRRRH